MHFELDTYAIWNVQAPSASSRGQAPIKPPLCSLACTRLPLTTPGEPPPGWEGRPGRPRGRIPKHRPNDALERLRGRQQVSQGRGPGRASPTAAHRAAAAASALPGRKRESTGLPTRYSQGSKSREAQAANRAPRDLGSSNRGRAWKRAGVRRALGRSPLPRRERSGRPEIADAAYQEKGGSWAPCFPQSVLCLCLPVEAAGSRGGSFLRLI